MLIICAWCRKEGKPAALREEEPLQQPVISYGICTEHGQQLLESAAGEHPNGPPPEGWEPEVS